ncbi:MAG: hypothetical protein FWH15_09550 [Betaproteobacteria bacterium]|nr:hypothetical protein [Betaproteobacteria bacterium]
MTPEEIRAARMELGLTQKECGARFGYSLSGWQKKENAGKNGRQLTNGEEELLLLLTGKHPHFILIRRKT